MATNEESQLFDLAADTESCVFAYEDVINLMQLLAEELSETMEGLNARPTYMAEVMRDRVPLYCSLLSAIREQTVTNTKN